MKRDKAKESDFESQGDVDVTSESKDERVWQAVQEAVRRYKGGERTLPDIIDDVADEYDLRWHRTHLHGHAKQILENQGYDV